MGRLRGALRSDSVAARNPVSRNPRFRSYNLGMSEIDRVRAWLERTACLLVDRPGAVSVEAIEQDGGTLYRICTDPSDVGKIIGKQGRNARSIRIILKAVGMKLKQNLSLDIAQ